jgi:CysZ protein
MLLELGRTMFSELRKLGYIAMWGIPALALFVIPVLNLAAPFIWMLFGAAVMVAIAIPLVNFLVIPAAVAGATILWVERLEKVVPGDRGTPGTGVDGAGHGAP